MTEVAVETSGVDALPTGGVRLNYIPREGGNTFKGMVFFTGANGALQGSNYDRKLQDRGLRVPGRVEKILDINPGFGGPIVRDTLWTAIRLLTRISYSLHGLALCQCPNATAVERAVERS